MPVGVRQHHDFRTSRQNIFRAESASKNRVNAEYREGGFGNRKALYLLWLGESCDAGRSARPQPHVLEGTALFAEGEVEGRRQIQIFEVDAGRRLPDANESVRVGIRERL